MSTLLKSFISVSRTCTHCKSSVVIVTNATKKGMKERIARRDAETLS